MTKLLSTSKLADSRALGAFSSSLSIFKKALMVIAGTCAGTEPCNDKLLSNSMLANRGAPSTGAAVCHRRLLTEDLIRTSYKASVASSLASAFLESRII